MDSWWRRWTDARRLENDYHLAGQERAAAGCWLAAARCFGRAAELGKRPRIFEQAVLAYALAEGGHAGGGLTDEAFRFIRSAFARRRLRPETPSLLAALLSADDCEALVGTLAVFDQLRFMADVRNRCRGPAGQETIRGWRLSRAPAALEMLAADARARVGLRA